VHSQEKSQAVAGRKAMGFRPPEQLSMALSSSLQNMQLALRLVQCSQGASGAPQGYIMRGV